MQPGERSIFERGCLRAGEEWLEMNLVPVAGMIVSTMVLQVSLELTSVFSPRRETLDYSFALLKFQTFIVNILIFVIKSDQVFKIS